MSEFINISDIMAEMREGKREIANGTHLIAAQISNTYLPMISESEYHSIEVCYLNDPHYQIRMRDLVRVSQISNGNVYFEGNYKHVKFCAKMPLSVFVTKLDTRKLSRYDSLELNKIVNLIAMYYYNETKKISKSTTIKAFSPYYIAKEYGMSEFDEAAFDLIIRYVTTEHFKTLAKNAKRELKKAA